MAEQLTPQPPQPGYICKVCGAPTPMGIGYVSYGPGAQLASQTSTHSHPLP